MGSLSPTPSCPDTPHLSFPTVPTLPHHTTSIPPCPITPHPPHPHLSCAFMPIFYLRTPLEGLPRWAHVAPYQRDGGCRRSPLPPAAVGVLYCLSVPPPPSLGCLPSKASPVPRWRRTHTLGGRQSGRPQERGTASAPPAPASGRGRAVVGEGEGQPHAGERWTAVPQGKETRPRWDAASRTSKGRVRRGAVQCGESPTQGKAADATPQPFPLWPPWVSPLAGCCSVRLEQHLPRGPWCPNPPRAAVQARPRQPSVLCLPCGRGVRCSGGLCMGWGWQAAGYILSRDPAGLPQGEAKPQKHHSSQKR